MRPGAFVAVRAVPGAMADDAERASGLTGEVVCGHGRRRYASGPGGLPEFLAVVLVADDQADDHASCTGQSRFEIHEAAE